MLYGNRKCILFCALAAFCIAAGLRAEEQKLAIVNVSYVFEKYNKVADVQRRVDDKHKIQKDELTQRAQELAKRNKDMEQLIGQEYASEAVFDRVQKLRRDQFKFEQELNALNMDIQKEYTKEMREVLADIRTAVRTIAEKGGFNLVLRSPDTDDPDTVNTANQPVNPAEGRTHLELTEPKTVAQLVERFNRNPVLFGAKTVDITKDVLAKLNDDYLKHSIGIKK